MNRLTPRMRRRIRRQLSGEKPTILIGKNGASQEILKEIEKQLEKREMIKIKILRSALKADKTMEVAVKIAGETKASLVDVRGHTFMLYRPHNR